MQEQKTTPSKEEIAELPEFPRLGLSQIALVSTGAEAAQAWAELTGAPPAPAWGFDTESKPTFLKNEASTGPHVVQLSTPHKAWVFQLKERECAQVVAQLLALPGPVKAGFGLGDDNKRLFQKLGAAPANVLDLNTSFREHGYRKDMGVKGAVAVLFGQRFIKSKKAGTSNWANARLTEAQVLYAANDAYGAAVAWHALFTGGACD